MQAGTPPLTEASGCAAAAAAASQPSTSEMDPAVKSGSLPSHSAIVQQQCLGQAALFSPGLDSGSALEQKMQCLMPRALPLWPLSKDGVEEQGAEGAPSASLRLAPEASSTSAAPTSSTLQHSHLSQQPSPTCMAEEQGLVQDAYSNGPCPQAAAAAPSLAMEGITSATQPCHLAGGSERLQQRRQVSCSSSGARTAADGLGLAETAGQVAPGLRSQTTGRAHSQRRHSFSSDPDHAQRGSTESLPAEAGTHLRQGQCGQAEGSMRLQRSHELIGRELFITASMLNHSCEPNCLVVRGQGQASIITQRPIQVHRPSTIPEPYYPGAFVSGC